MKTERINCFIGGLLICGLTAACEPNDNSKFEDLEISQAQGSRIGSGLRFLSACPSSVNGPISEIRDPAPPPKKKQTPASGKIKALDPLGTALVATGVDLLLDLFAQGLVAEQEGHTGQFLSTGVYLGKERVMTGAKTHESEDGCIVLYRGLTGNPPAEGVAPETRLEQARLRALGLSSRPALYVEFLVREPNGLNKRMLELNRVEYAASSAARKGSGFKSVSIVIGLGAQKAVDPETNEILDAAVSELFRFNLGRLEIGKFYSSDRNVRAIAPKAAEPGTNMVALVTEADQESVVLKALTAAFEQNKSALDDALTDKAKAALN